MWLDLRSWWNEVRNGGRKLQPTSDGYFPQWSTDEMDRGEETIQQHMMTGHGLSQMAVDSIDTTELFKLHDKMHAEAGDNEVLAAMNSTGFGMFMGY